MPSSWIRSPAGLSEAVSALVTRSPVHGVSAGSGLQARLLGARIRLLLELVRLGCGQPATSSARAG